LTAEQLQAARAERWRQKSNPALTLEDAAAWINTTGLCLFLPRRHQFLAPAPSFVEASIGAPSETPAPAAIENAAALMIRLIESGAALPLNLFSTLSEQPDFLASREAFPYIFSLRGGRNWKTPPPRASPLVTEIWKLLEDRASLEVTEIQAALGREITEAAALRGLMELWSGLRVMPVYTAGEPTRWELTQTRFADLLNAANKIAQTTSLSVLVSLYLESVLAATPEEVETFLSPLTSRSKVRDVVNGLAATRQISIVPVGTQTMYHVTGSLPEFAEPEPPAPSEVVTRPSFDRDRPSREERSPERRLSFGRDRTGERPRTGPSRDRFAASGSDRPRPRPAGGARPGGAGRSSGRPLRTGTDPRGNYPPRRKQFGANAGGPPRPRAEGDRPPYRKSGEGKPSGNYPPRKGADGERKFPKRPFGQRPFNKASDSAGPSSAGHSSARPGSARSDRPARPYGARNAEDRPRFDSRGGGGKFPPKKFGADGDKFPPKKFGKPKFERSSKPKFGAGKFGAGRPGGGEKRPFFRDKPGKPGEGRPDKPERREGFEGSSAPSQRGGWKPKPSGFSKSAKPGSGKPGFGRPGIGKPKFGAKKFGAPKFGSAKPGGANFGEKKYGGPKDGRPKFRGKSDGARSGFKSGPRSGGTKPPFRKRKDEGKDKGNKSSE